jgi:4-hydroxybenzoate polyprenyltransferase
MQTSPAAAQTSSDPEPGFLAKVHEYWVLSRPFTLLAPLVGYLSAGSIAYKVNPPEPGHGLAVAFNIVLGSLVAASLNAASNALNQIYDLEIDRVNKPDRPLPAGRLTLREAWIFSIVCYVLTILLSAYVNTEFLVIVVFTAFLTYAYSGPPFRTKRFGILANLTIAIPRGCLLKVAGWSAVATVLDPEPWWIGMIFGLYVLGSATTKDYSDIEGDRAYGCKTLPIRFGIVKSAWMISPFFVLPFLLLSALALMGMLHANVLVMVLLGLFLAAWGAYIAYLILANPHDLAVEANHVSWKHMYLLMMVAQVGVAVAYFVPHS